MARKLKRKIAFFNIFKWFLASTFIGAVVGVFNGLFLKLLPSVLSFTNSYHYYFLALPFGLALVNYLARKVAPGDKGYSTNEAIAAINDLKPVSLKSAAKAFFLPILTIGVGGSAGKESPCADVGAGLAAFFSGIFSFNVFERRKLMICGVSAGFAGVFGVPISGALFGLEVLSVGTVFYEVMFPAFISGITSYQITQLMGVEYIYHPMVVGALHLDASLLTVVAAGLFFGLLSLLFMEVIKVTKILFRFIGLRFSTFWKIFLASALLIAVGLLASPVYLGLGMERVDAILAGDRAYTLGFLFKMLTTALTFAGGGVGGMITPVMFIGANAGYFFADMLGLNTVTFAALGIVSILAGVANTPLAASVMAIELFGASIAPYAAVSCIISFLVTGRRSLFSKQRFAFDKALSDEHEIEQHTMQTQTPRAPKRTIKEKNFLLEMVRHLVPGAKAHRKHKEPAGAPHDNGKKPFSFINLLNMGHLFPTNSQEAPPRDETDTKAK
ncbi:MAG: chloride channel protein [Elusimicrobiota bacterium]|jgi:H+/Cl- antiporter ClcA|nr:chloride channel protein [Elusimicrobiota bacterium]